LVCIFYLNFGFSQLEGVDSKNGDLILLVSLDELENVIDSCISQMGIGSALNYLSNSTWELQGGGQNIRNGDSLFFSNRENIINKEDFYAFVMDYSFDAAAAEYPDVKFKIGQYMLQFQFSDKNNFNNVVEDISNYGYAKTKEEFFKNHSVLTFEKNNFYVVELFTINTEENTVFLYRISSKN
jgi:hypothetical protein